MIVKNPNNFLENNPHIKTLLDQAKERYVLNLLLEPSKGDYKSASVKWDNTESKTNPFIKASNFAEEVLNRGYTPNKIPMPPNLIQLINDWIYHQEAQKETVYIKGSVPKKK